MHNTLLQLLSGVLIAGYLLAGLFFFKFWKDTRDRLFICFAAAFWILAVQRTLLSLSSAEVEDQTHLFLLRLLAYALFLGAIIDKNRQGTPIGDADGESKADGPPPPGTPSL